MKTSVSMKQLFGLLGMNYQEVADFFGLNKSTIEKRVRRDGGWDLSEVTLIVQKIKKETGIDIDYKNIRA